MEIKKEKPPNYNEIVKNFPAVEQNNKVIFTYGNTIYNPHDVYVSPDLEVHEETHSVRQIEQGADNWWKKYFDDAEFRLEEELFAYKNQYNFIKEKFTNKTAKQALEFFASTLSSELYGEIITFHEAHTKIRKSL